MSFSKVLTVMTFNAKWLWFSCCLSPPHLLSIQLQNLVAELPVWLRIEKYKVDRWQKKQLTTKSTNCTNRWTSNNCNRYQTISAFISLLISPYPCFVSDTHQNAHRHSWDWRGGQQPKIRKEGGGKQSNADKRREGPTWEKHETTVYTFDKSDHYSRLNFSLLFWISPYRCTGRPHF